MKVLRSLAFNFAFFVGSAIVLTPILPLLLLPRRPLLQAGRIWAGGVMFLLRTLVGIRYEVRGPVELLRGPAVIAVKHQSAWDTIAFFLLADDPVYVMKKELMHIPLYGWFARKLGMIPADRDGGGVALRRIMRAAEDALARNRQIIIFPQGTRVPPGESAPYWSGVAALYTKLERPVVPVALNSGLFWGRRSFIKNPGTIIVEIMPPIAAGLKRRDFARELEDRIETCTSKLEAEGRSA